MPDTNKFTDGSTYNAIPYQKVSFLIYNNYYAAMSFLPIRAIEWFFYQGEKLNVLNILVNLQNRYCVIWQLRVVLHHNKRWLIFNMLLKYKHTSANANSSFYEDHVFLK